MNEELLRAAGFEPCLTPPPGWTNQEETVYTRLLPKGQAYVRCLPDVPGMVEAFVGNWQQPMAYCRGAVRNVEQLLWLLS
jgi:hypothetical protein